MISPLLVAGMVLWYASGVVAFLAWCWNSGSITVADLIRAVMAGTLGMLVAVIWAIESRQLDRVVFERRIK